MSPVMVVPLVALAALLVMPGRLPEPRATVVAREQGPAVARRVASSRFARDAGKAIVIALANVP